MNKIKKQDFIHYTILFLIILAAIIIRLINLNKPYGLWLDEMISYIVASQGGFIEIIKYLYFDIHAPFYYILLHYWMNLFGNSDTILRIFSVFCGVLTVYFLYLTGKIIDSKKLGLVAAFFCAINPFQIYYSQEVRLYSLISLLAIMVIYFAILYIKKPSIATQICFIVANFAIMYTHTIGFVFIFFEILCFGIYIYLKHNPILKSFLISTCTLALLFIPFSIPFFIQVTSPYAGVIAQWWSKINIDKIILSFGDLFSPFFLNIYGTDESFTSYFLSNGSIEPVFFIFWIIPCLITIIGLLSALKDKNIFIRIIFLICVGFILIFTGAYFKGKILFISRYIMEVSPLLILVFVYGLLKIKNEKLSVLLMYIQVLICLSAMFIFKTPAFHDNRISGLGTPVEVLKSFNLTKQDKIVSIYYQNKWFEKYYPENQGAPMDCISFMNIGSYIHPENDSFAVTLDKETLKNFITGKDIKYYQNKIINDFIKPLPKKQYFVILTDERFHSYSSKELTKLGKKPDFEPEQTTMPLMLFSRIGETLINSCDKELKLIKKEVKNEWELYIYQKIK